MTINKLAESTPQNPYLLPNGHPLSYRQLLRRPKSDPLLVDVANYTDFYSRRAGLTDLSQHACLPALGRASQCAAPANVRRYDWPSPHQSFSPAACSTGSNATAACRFR